MQYCIWVVSPRGYSHSSCFAETAESLQYAFKELGYEVPIVHSSNAIPRTHRPIIIGANLLKANDSIPNVFIPIVYNLEQISLGKFNAWTTPGYIDFLKHVVVWDYSASNIKTLSTWGVSAEHLEIGYSKNLTRIEPTEPEIDVLFYGCINERRKIILDNLKSKGLNVLYLFNFYGKERDEKIAKSKVILNLHFYESKVFEIIRCSYLLANKKCIVSERGNDKELEGKYEGGIEFCEYDGIVDTVTRLVCDGDAAGRLAEMGFEIFSKTSQAEYLKKVLE